MQPSRIIKSAYRRAVKAGFQGSLKEWANKQTASPIVHPTPDTAQCMKWRNNKAKQRKPSRNRKAAHSNHDVHEMLVVRSTRNASGSNIALRGEVTDTQGSRS